MRIFVYEYFSASGSSSPLQAEGRAMLSAVAADFFRIPEIELRTISSDEEGAFRFEARRADVTLVIAPECDDLLYTRCRWAEEEGSRLLNPSSAAVRLTGDKLALSEFLRKREIPTPLTISSSLSEARIDFPAVLKPRFGAGSLATFLIRETSELQSAIERASQEEWPGECILQSFIPGIPASVAFLIGPNQMLALLSGRQILSTDGRFSYQGGCLPLSGELAERATRLARQAVEVIPGLNGYVGVDLILGEAADGSADRVIEVNPRLTTSYLGLRALSEMNLAEAMLQIVSGMSVPTIGWGPGVIEFDTRGNIREMV